MCAKGENCNFAHGEHELRNIVIIHHQCYIAAWVPFKSINQKQHQSIHVEQWECRQHRQRHADVHAGATTQPLLEDQDVQLLLAGQV